MEMPKDHALTTAHHGDWLTFSLDTSANRIEVLSFYLGAPSHWYLAEEGDALTRSNIDAGMFDVFSEHTDAGHETNPIDLEIGDFFLVVEFRSTLGWVKMSYDGTDLRWEDSAVAHNEPGIFVGTMKVVPEPAALALILGSLALLWVQVKNL